MGSAVWKTWVTGTGGGKRSESESETESEGRGGGRGKCSRRAASNSPGASKATAGNPNVEPRREAREPPNECPTSQIFEPG